MSPPSEPPRRVTDRGPDPTPPPPPSTRPIDAGKPATNFGLVSLLLPLLFLQLFLTFAAQLLLLPNPRPSWPSEWTPASHLPESGRVAATSEPNHSDNIASGLETAIDVLASPDAASSPPTAAAASKPAPDSESQGKSSAGNPRRIEPQVPLLRPGTNFKFKTQTTLNPTSAMRPPPPSTIGRGSAGSRVNVATRGSAVKSTFAGSAGFLVGSYPMIGLTFILLSAAAYSVYRMVTWRRRSDQSGPSAADRRLLGIASVVSIVVAGLSTAYCVGLDRWHAPTVSQAGIALTEARSAVAALGLPADDLSLLVRSLPGPEAILERFTPRIGVQGGSYAEALSLDPPTAGKASEEVARATERASMRADLAALNAIRRFDDALAYRSQFYLAAVLGVALSSVLIVTIYLRGRVTSEPTRAVESAI